jgi:hypothetical protein
LCRNVIPSSQPLRDGATLFHFQIIFGDSMKRCRSVPIFHEDGEGVTKRDDGDADELPPSTSEEPLAETKTIDSVMQKVEGILGTPNFGECDLNQMTSEQFAKLNSLMQEAELIEQPASLMWKDLSYLRDDRRIFQGVSGFIKPGMMICCLGPSSSGISSFLRVLAARHQRGVVHGEILLNGSSYTTIEIAFNLIVCGQALEPGQISARLFLMSHSRICISGME